MEEKIRELLTEELPEIDFAASEALVDDGFLDSLSITMIISTLSLEFGINIPYDEITEDNFNSIKSISAMVENLCSQEQ